MVLFWQQMIVAESATPWTEWRLGRDQRPCSLHGKHAWSRLLGDLAAPCVGRVTATMPMDYLSGLPLFVRAVE
jgi:hypothetical protein